MATNITQKPRTEYWRDYSRYRYETKGDKLNLKSAIKYYRKKKEQGLEWIPKPKSKLYVWCQLHNLDPIAIIEGTQSIQDAQ